MNESYSCSPSSAVTGVFRVLNFSHSNRCVMVCHCRGFFVCLDFSGLHPWHVEVPRLGAELELWVPIYATATAMWDPSHVWDLHHSSQQCQIPNPLSEARPGIEPSCLWMSVGFIMAEPWQELLSLFSFSFSWYHRMWSIFSHAYLPSVCLCVCVCVVSIKVFVPFLHWIICFLAKKLNSTEEKRESSPRKWFLKKKFEWWVRVG